MTFTDPLLFNTTGSGLPYATRNLFIDDREDALIVMRTIRDLTPTITGSGAMRTTGQHTWTVDTNYRVKIDTAGFPADATFTWSNDGGATWEATLVPVYLAVDDYMELEDGIKIQFSNDGIFDLNDLWDFVAIALASQVYDLNVDTTNSTVQVGTTLEVVDSDFSLSLAFGADSPTITFNTDAFIWYSRSIDTMLFAIGASTSTLTDSLLDLANGTVLRMDHAQIEFDDSAFATPTPPVGTGQAQIYAKTDLPYWQNSTAEYPILLSGAGMDATFDDVSINVLTVDNIVMQTAAQTFTALTRLLDFSTTITLNYATPSVHFIDVRATVEFQQTQAGQFNGPFAHSATYKNKSGSNVNPAGVLVIADSGTIESDGQTLTANTYRTVHSSPTVTRINAGTLTIASVYGLLSQGIIGAGATVTDRAAVKVVDITNSGTLTNNYGIDIDALSAGGTLNVGIRNADAYRGTKYMSLLGATVTPTNVTAGDFTAIRGLFGADIAIPAGGSQLVVNQGTIGSDIMRVQTVSAGDDPCRITQGGYVTTTNASAATLWTYTIPASTTVTVTARIVARRTGGTAGTAEDGAGYMISATFKNVAGTATQIGATSNTVVHEDVTAYVQAFDVTGATCRVRVTGVLDTNISWSAIVDIMQVSA